MKKNIFGIILITIELILMAIGITCLIVGSVLNKIAQAYQAPLVNSLFALGFFGVGCFISTPLTIAATYFMLKD